MRLTIGFVLIASYIMFLSVFVVTRLGQLGIMDMYITGCTDSFYGIDLCMPRELTEKYLESLETGSFKALAKRDSLDLSGFVFLYGKEKAPRYERKYLVQAAKYILDRSGEISQDKYECYPADYIVKFELQEMKGILIEASGGDSILKLHGDSCRLYEHL